MKKRPFLVLFTLLSAVFGAAAQSAAVIYLRNPSFEEKDFSHPKAWLLRWIRSIVGEIMLYYISIQADFFRKGGKLKYLCRLQITFNKRNTTHGLQIAPPTS